MTRSGVLLLSLLSAAAAQAEQWSITPRVYARGEHADNPRLTWNDGDDTIGSITDVSLDIERRTETADFSIVSGLEHRSFSGDDSLDGSDGRVRVTLDRTGERHSWNLDSSWKLDSTLTSEAGTTGFTQVNKRREVLGASAGWSYMLSDRATLDASASGSETKYRDAERTGLVDYRYVSGSLSMGYALSDRLQAALGVNAGQLNVPDVPTADTDQYGVTAQLAYIWNELWKSTLYAGPQRVKGEASTDDGVTYGVTLSRHAETASLSISLSRSVEPTGRGVLARRDALEVTETYSFSERVSMELQAAALRNEDAVQRQPATQEILEYGRITAALSWNWTRYLRSRVALTWRTQHSDLVNERAEDQAVSLGIVWTPAAIVSWR